LGPASAAADEILVCQNGLLHLPTLALTPPTPAFFALNALDYDFDAAAGTEH
jgi:hypothetical protein